MSLRPRLEIVRDIEASGVVAVIRLKELERLRAVIDALTAGGARSR
jgi:2-keto-3-deoxy-6-phosphogluconate aldolase